MRGEQHERKAHGEPDGHAEDQAVTQSRPYWPTRRRRVCRLLLFVLSHGGVSRSPNGLKFCRGCLSVAKAPSVSNFELDLPPPEVVAELVNGHHRSRLVNRPVAAGAENREVFQPCFRGACAKIAEWIPVMHLAELSV